MQIAQHLEASPSGSSWYAAPAPAPAFTSLTGSDGVSEPAFRGLGADDEEEDAIPFPDVPPPLYRRMGALRSNILGLI